MKKKNKKDPFRVKLNWWEWAWWTNLKRRKQKVYLRELVKEHIQYNKYKSNGWERKPKPRHRAIAKASEWRHRVEFKLEWCE